jgi:hypothetical protein
MYRALLAAIAAVVVIGPALAHIHGRPDLNEWAGNLRASGGGQCCDNSEATPMIDADWRVDKAGRYEVLLEGAWREVPATAVVKEPNKYGQTLVWYYHIYNAVSGDIVIRCFLPAAGV